MRRSMVNGGAVVHAADDVFQAGVEGQFHEVGTFSLRDGFVFAVFAGTIRTNGVYAAGFDIAGQATILTEGAFNIREKVEQTAGGRGFACAARANEENPANDGVDHIEQEGEFHIVLADNAEKWESVDFGDTGVICGGGGADGKMGGAFDQLLQ